MTYSVVVVVVVEIPSIYLWSWGKRSRLLLSADMICHVSLLGTCCVIFILAVEFCIFTRFFLFFILFF